jgi:hypothetical protein
MPGFTVAPERLGAILLLLAAACLPAAAQASEPVEMMNASHPTQCAEEDNVYVKFIGPKVQRFEVTVQHPVYIGDVAEDSTAPDFSQCDMSHDPSFPFTPRDVVLYDDGHYRLMGHTYKTNWRPEVVPFRVVERGASKEEQGLHLVQLFRYVDGVPIEIVVLYPADGYWRAKPLPPVRHPETAYGSSFLLGPIEEQGRPLVRISSVEFRTGGGLMASFRLQFAQGGSGEVKVLEASRVRTVLGVYLYQPRRGDLPFAALRSMFVTPTQADVSETTWRSAPQGDAETHSILDFSDVTVTEARFGRTTKSAHNLSAPDLSFGAFSFTTIRP